MSNKLKKNQLLKENKKLGKFVSDFYRKNIRINNIIKIKILRDKLFTLNYYFLLPGNLNFLNYLNISN